MGTMTLQQFRLILAATLIDERTLRKYLAGGRVRRSITERIQSAMRDLGLREAA
jgi:hypothetical protein